MTDSIENQYLYQKQTVCKTFETKLFIDKKEKMSFVCAMPNKTWLEKGQKTLDP